MTSLDDFIAAYAPRLDTFLSFEAITAGTTLPRPANGIYVGGTGNVSLIRLDGVAVTIPNVQAGTLIRTAHLGVASPGTTASGFVAFY